MSLMEQSATYAMVASYIANKTEEYLRTGIASFTPPYEKGVSSEEQRRAYRKQLSVCGNTFVRAYLRQVAKELRRPFIVAEQTYSCGANTTIANWITLSVPKRKKLEKAVSALLLSAKDIKHRYGYYLLKEAPGIYRYNYHRSLWQFIFNGDGCEGLFQSFVQTWQADPDIRAALKLTK